MKAFDASDVLWCHSPSVARAYPRMVGRAPNVFIKPDQQTGQDEPVRCP